MTAERGVSQVRSLARLARALARSRPLEELVELAAEEALAGAEGATVSVSRLEAGVGQVRTLLNVGDLGPTEERWPENEVYELDALYALTGLAEHGTPWRSDLDDPDGDPLEQALLRELGKGSAVGRPIMAGDTVWGELYVTRHVGDPPVPEEWLAYLDALSAILGVALVRHEREEALTRMAYHDPLTGLPNRRALDERAALAFAVPEGVVRVATAVMVDINGLKHVNDSQGHGVGDRLIVTVAESLQRSFSRLAGSLVARVGGDEFVVLVVGHPPEAVRRATDELCGLTWSFGVPVSVSCGTASLRLAGGSEEPRELFAAADAAQYVAKRAGLRRAAVAGEEPLPPAAG